MNRDDLEAFLSALSFAANKHRDQRRKDRESPYINHPIELAALLVTEADISEPQVLIAALLHDTIEDTETSHEELVDRFGEAIADIVLEVTDDQSLPKAQRKQLQIDHAAAASRPARLVKLADKICNLRDIQRRPPAGWDEQRKREYFDWAKQVVDELRGTDAHLEALFDEAYAERPG